ncbi:unnamed protein product [Diabrotica balteata]|uniref:Uncharacterized protein n=1 Tax=Diabrotica balteata TaxID=107213 RepID=A0A9N9XAB4_DIABA|nr:unnamed protein product [Diabrotica balteata]
MWAYSVPQEIQTSPPECSNQPQHTDSPTDHSKPRPTPKAPNPHRAKKTKPHSRRPWDPTPPNNQQQPPPQETHECPKPNQNANKRPKKHPPTTTNHHKNTKTPTTQPRKPCPPQIIKIGIPHNPKSPERKTAAPDTPTPDKHVPKTLPRS